MSFPDFVSGFVRSKIPALNKPAHKPMVDFLTKLCMQPNEVKTLKLNPQQQQVAKQLFEALRDSLGQKAEAYPTTLAGVSDFFHKCSQFLATEFQKRTARPRSRSVAAVEDAPGRSRSRSRSGSPRPPAESRSRSGSRSQSGSPRPQSRSGSPAPRQGEVAAAAAPVTTPVQHRRPRVSFVHDVDDLGSTPILGATSTPRNQSLVPYNNPNRVYESAYDSDSSDSLSDCDDNVFESSKWVCRHVYKKACGRKKAGDTCGREYHSPKYLCPNCGCCSGLHVMSGHQIITKNPLHCKCMSKKYCGGHGGRKRCGLPCDVRQRGGGRCLRHRHKQRSMKPKKRLVRAVV